MTVGLRSAALIVAVVLVSCALPVAGRTRLQTARADEPKGLQLLFGLYDRGEYEAFDRQVTDVKKVPDDWRDFDRDALLWIAAVSEMPEVERRRLVSASVALELAYVHRGRWDRARALIEEGCRLLHLQLPSPPERAWHLAAASLAQTVADYQFFLLDETAPAPPPNRVNPPSAMWLNHGRHATLRFPDEPALALAHGIALETRGLVNMMNEDYPVWIPKAGVEKAMASGVPALPPNARIDAESALALLKQRTNPVPAAEKSLHLWNVAALMRTAAAGTESGPEGRMRLGYTFLRLAQTEGALVELQRAEKSATTPFVRYMARYFGGVAFERLRRRSDAVLAYRGALEAVPRAQSATIALSSILFQQGDRDEAADLALRALAPPLADDPIKYYKGGEAPAQWKVRIAALRKVLR